MSKRLDVNYEGSYSYSIFIERDYKGLVNCLDGLDTRERRALIVSDENVAPLLLSEIRELLSGCFASVDSIVLRAGEEHKNTAAVEEIYEKAIEQGLDRRDYMVALGGGVVGDMTGFAAASYMRGIRFIQLPTTLLSQVDSSIGGKTGVDFKKYKNMVGAFHMPSLVYSSASALKTLDSRQFASGMGEVIKHAMIKDRDYLYYLIENANGLKMRDSDVLMETVYRSNIIKKEVVEHDPREMGERKLLNFGHTLGHAIESCSGFSYTHGQCVIFGALAAANMSRGLTSGEKRDVVELCDNIGLNTALMPMDAEAVIRAARRDKKMDRGQISFILLRGLGDAYIDSTVSEEAMTEGLLSIMED